MSLLYSTSRMEELEVALERLLEEIKGIRQLTVPVDAMLRFASRVRGDLQEQFSPDNVKEYLTRLEALQENKNHLFRNIATRGRYEIMQSGDTIFSLIIQGESADETARQLNDRLRAIVSEEFTRANVLLDATFELGAIRIDPIQVHIAEPIEPSKSDMADSVREWWEPLLEIALPQLPRLPLLGKDTLPGGHIIKSIPNLPCIPSTSVPQVWVITEIVKGLIGLVKRKHQLEVENQKLFELIGEQNARVQEAINRQITDVMSANSKIRAEMYRLEEEFMNRILDMIDHGYSKLSGSLEDLYQSEQMKVGKVKDHLKELDGIVEELQRFRLRLQPASKD